MCMLSSCVIYKHFSFISLSTSLFIQSSHNSHSLVLFMCASSRFYVCLLYHLLLVPIHFSLFPSLTMLTMNTQFLYLLARRIFLSTCLSCRRYWMSLLSSLSNKVLKHFLPFLSVDFSKTSNCNRKLFEWFCFLKNKAKNQETSVLLSDFLQTVWI